MTLQHERKESMAEIYLSLNEVAELEGVPYKTIQQRVNRNPENYQLKKEQRECGGKDLSMIALSSLSKKAVTAYKERQKLAEVPAVPGMEEVAVSGESEVPWYVNEDVDYFMEQHKTEWYTAMELGNIVREFLNYDSAGRTEFAEYLEKESVPYTDMPRVIWKHQRGRTSCISRMAAIMIFSKCCVCAGNRRKPGHFQVSPQK